MARRRFDRGSRREPDRVVYGSGSVRAGRTLLGPSFLGELLRPRAVAVSYGPRRPSGFPPGRARSRPRVLYGPRVSVSVRRPRLNLVAALRPAFSRLRKECVSRVVRREVMFSRDVAGRKWSRGRGAGPDMREARHSLFSQMACR